MRNQSRRFLRSRFGVSLIEALMVVLLLSATASMAIFKMPSIKSIDSARQSALSFTSMLRTARDLAVSKQAPVTVTLDRKSKPAQWVFDAAGSVYGPASKWVVPLEGQTQVDGTTTPIRFDETGNASYFGEWKFRGTNGYYVMLEPIGARVTMKSLD